MIIELIILLVLLLIILLFILSGIKYRKTIKILTDINTELDKQVKSLRYNYDNLMKLYKSTINKMKNLQRQLKNKGK